MKKKFKDSLFYGYHHYLYKFKWLDYGNSLYEHIPVPIPDTQFMGMFSHNMPPPPMGPPDWYHPFMSNMYEGRGGVFRHREYPPFRDVPEQIMMMRDAPPDTRGYPMPMPTPEMLEQYHPPMGRSNPSSVSNPPSSTQRYSGRSTMESHSFYGPGLMGDGITPRPSGMTHPPQYPWNVNPQGSLWPGRHLPPQLGWSSGYAPLEGSGARDDDDDDSGGHGEDDHPRGKSMPL